MRLESNSRLAEVESALRETSAQLTHRREVYEEMVRGMRVFAVGSEDSEQLSKLREELGVAYAKAWLWAPDDTIRTINELLDIHVSRPPPKDEKEERTREGFVSAVVSMRRDAGHPNTTLEVDDYRWLKPE